MEKEPFQNLVIFFSCLRDKVHTVYSILLKLAQIVRIIIDINPIANEENLLDSFGRREIWNFEFSYCIYM